VIETDLERALIILSGSLYCTVSTPVGVVRPKMSAFPAMLGRFFRARPEEQYRQRMP